MRCSVMQTTWSSSSLNATRFTAVGNSQKKRHFPVSTDHRRIVLSAEPLTRKRDEAACCGGLAAGRQKIVEGRPEDQSGEVERCSRGNHRSEEKGGVYHAVSQSMPEQKGERRTVNIDRPDRPVMPIVCPQPLSIVRVPDVDDAIFRGCEEEVAFAVELDLCERTLVACRMVLVRFRRSMCMFAATNPGEESASVM